MTLSVTLRVLQTLLLLLLLRGSLTILFNSVQLLQKQTCQFWLLTRHIVYAILSVHHITYRHLLLTTHRYSTSSVFIGPCLIHYRKNSDSFFFFANSLISRWRWLEALRCFGTDGEKELVDVFLHEFRFSVHLHEYCHIHVHANIKNELHKRKICEQCCTCTWVCWWNLW